ncbi:hypothetical protein O181_051837 [Austropuccinia psidii MF-1]|uniref:Uncharacterized protein n=1 Tax=Austropuccinia psidii MF-1 TaxID=1389203 RepID=A0A9Q3E1Q4_9BASI|nr:hypothetical protein [Austropuccinia psidii MF-1]
MKPNGNCGCLSSNSFACSTTPTGYNRLPTGQITCGTLNGCSSKDQPEKKFICFYGFPIGVLQPDGRFKGWTSWQADGHCQCDENNQLRCNGTPTGLNTLPSFGKVTCGKRDSC